MSSVCFLFSAVSFLPFAMIATFITAKIKRRDAWHLMACGSMLYFSFVIPWIDMMLKLIGHQLWGWVLHVSRCCVFFGLISAWFLLSFLLWGPRRTEPIDIETILLFVDWIVLLIGLIVLFLRYFAHRAVSDRYGASNCHRTENLICTRCVEPFLFGATWYMLSLAVLFLYNSPLSLSIDTVVYVFLDYDEENAFAYRILTIGYIVLSTCLVFLTGYLVVRLGRQLTNRLRTSDRDDV